MSRLASSLIPYIEESGLLDLNASASKILLWNPCYSHQIENLANIIVQSFRPYFQEWEKKHTSVFPTIENIPQVDSIYCILPKQKEAAHYHLARSCELLDDDGLLVVIAENEAGGKRLKKWFEELGLSPNSVSKSKCRIVWACKQNLNSKILSLWAEQGKEQNIQTNYGDFYTKPGIYGWKKIDRGSEILIEHLPSGLSGKGADFGCGYGFLSRVVFAKSKNIEKLYAVDADYDALECCKKNMSRFDSQTEFLWEDLTQPVKRLPDLDWIIMNPPFHEGKDVDANIGQSFIQRASESLKHKGILYMVANAHLPYEKILNQNFQQVEKLTERDGFKVFKAVK